MTPPVGTRSIGTVVLVDDAEADNFLHRRAFEAAGITAEIVTCIDAQRALDHLADDAGAAGPPAMILLDINMPGMNGWEFIDRYRRLPVDHRADRLVVLTTSDNPTDRERAASIELIDAFVTKPLDAGRLRDLVDRFFAA